MLARSACLYRRGRPNWGCSELVCFVAFGRDNVLERKHSEPRADSVKDSAMKALLTRQRAAFDAEDFATGDTRLDRLSPALSLADLSAPADPLDLEELDG